MFKIVEEWMSYFLKNRYTGGTICSERQRLLAKFCKENSISLGEIEKRIGEYWDCKFGKGVK